MKTKAIIFCLFFVELIAIEWVLSTPIFGGSGGLGQVLGGPGLFRPGFAHHGFANPGFGAHGLGFGRGLSHQSWGLGLPSLHGIRNGFFG